MILHSQKGSDLIKEHINDQWCKDSSLRFSRDRRLLRPSLRRDRRTQSSIATNKSPVLWLTNKGSHTTKQNAYSSSLFELGIWKLFDSMLSSHQVAMSLVWAQKIFVWKFFNFRRIFSLHGQKKSNFCNFPRTTKNFWCWNST